ncbi:TIGR00270 family protein, partial [Candidatus Parvarchaeota archaeon]|nr:TIGR00270 family protein [Candidatus Parvarchaeota archaeon]
MACEMCGSKAGLFRAIVEDTEMRVCRDCCRFGKVLGEIRQGPKRQPSQKAAGAANASIAAANAGRNEPVELIVENFNEIIRKKREQMGLTQKDFAMLVAERESVVHKIETGVHEPDIKLARKLEKMLRIKLVEKYE